MKKTANSKKPKKQQQKRIIVTAIAVGAAGILGYFGWQYLKKRKSAKGGDLDEVLKTVPGGISTDAPTTSSTINPDVLPKPSSSQAKATKATGFPLKKGSKGHLVIQLQEALIESHGRAILPKYGADGDFGTETVNALKKLGLPVTIDQNTFNVLVSSKSAQTDAASIGRELIEAANSRNFSKAIAALKKIKGTEGYAAANEMFKTLRINGGVRQTIVNGMLNTFSKPDQKEKIKFEFLRMGLQFDGNKWSLSGLDGLPLITISPTTVWIDAQKGVKVPARMVLGNEVSRRLDYTLFQNKGKYFLVQTNCIKHLSA